MADIAEQLAAIEKEIRETPYHKGTEHHIGILRARIARLKDKQAESGSKKGGGGGGYAIKKQGDATIVLIGPPSAGKSTLINKFTNAESKVAPYAFTTVSVIPGMMEYKDAKIQILDVPGLIEGAGGGKGRGKEVLSVARNCDLIVFMTDPKRMDFLKKLVKELEEAGIRINRAKPQVKIERKINGGLMIHSNIKQDLSKATIKEIAEEFGIKNGEIAINEKLTLPRLIDTFAKNRVYIPAIYVINKSDTMTKKEDSEIDPRILRISAENDKGLDTLKEAVWKKLNLLTIYLVRQDEEPNKKSPMIVKNNTTLMEIAQKIGPEFAASRKSAKIWGTGAKWNGQEVSLNTKVEEGMQVRFI